MGAAYARQSMEERRIAVNRFKMGDVLFLDPHCVERVMARRVGHKENKDVFRMLIADGEKEIGQIDATIQ